MMQSVAVTILGMSKTVKRNFQWPYRINELFDLTAGERKQWVVAAAAILMFAEASDKERSEYMKRIGAASADADFDALVARASAKLQGEAAARIRDDSAKSIRNR